MSSDYYRRQLERIQYERASAERHVSDCRTKEADSRAAATRKRDSAARSSTRSSIESYLRDAARADDQANRAGKEGAQWQTKVAKLAKDEASLNARIVSTERTERQAESRTRARAQAEADRRTRSERDALERRLAETESLAREAAASFREPKRERLRILMLGASSEGDLRVGREQKRIRAAVETALHRDLVELDVRPSATTNDLLDGLARFRPHIVHFSGHAADDLIIFEDEIDEPHSGVVVTARAFANALAATDDPPLLIVVNACNTAAQVSLLVEQVAPFAIGMSADIDDADAISYAAQFYAALANGQSLRSAHLLGVSALELAGLDASNLPTLGCRQGVDPGTTVLVRPPSSSP